MTEAAELRMSAPLISLGRRLVALFEDDAAQRREIEEEWLKDLQQEKGKIGRAHV